MRLSIQEVIDILSLKRPHAILILVCRETSIFRSCLTAHHVLIPNQSIVRVRGARPMPASHNAGDISVATEKRELPIGLENTQRP